MTPRMFVPTWNASTGSSIVTSLALMELEAYRSCARLPTLYFATTSLFSQTAAPSSTRRVTLAGDVVGEREGLAEIGAVLGRRRLLQRGSEAAVVIAEGSVALRLGGIGIARPVPVVSRILVVVLVLPGRAPGDEHRPGGHVAAERADLVVGRAIQGTEHADHEVGRGRGGDLPLEAAGVLRVLRQHLPGDAAVVRPLDVHRGGVADRLPH